MKQHEETVTWSDGTKLTDSRHPASWSYPDHEARVWFRMTSKMRVRVVRVEYGTGESFEAP